MGECEGVGLVSGVKHRRFMRVMVQTQTRPLQSATEPTIKMRRIDAMHLLSWTG